ncbi:DUF3102 domain-containing protein [Paenibacillus popilliae]|uniref:DNA modification methylase n=1 Tax=Paenibacillus popilliae ATCC 14706 TaxID=1212764 RepID=M9L9B4_PAEPP|nr:DUF3102 domain-containing protein [Paenibacillus popilliae]GAC41977.1 DNA modification methylase [Paenibacillus popilliae ATCC 14706]
MKTITNRDQPQELSTDIHVITAEINAYKRIAGEAIFEIGRRLKHVKENDLVHGEWERWCREEIGMTPQHVNRFIRIYIRFENRTSLLDLGVAALAHLVDFTDEQIARPHAIPSTGEIKLVDDMTVRELREVKKALKEAEARAQKAEQDYELVRETLESIESQPQPEPIVIEKPVYQVREVIPANVQSRIDEVERRLEEAESERDETKYGAWHIEQKYTAFPEQNRRNTLLFGNTMSPN